MALDFFLFSLIIILHKSGSDTIPWPATVFFSLNKQDPLLTRARTWERAAVWHSDVSWVENYASSHQKENLIDSVMSINVVVEDTIVPPCIFLHPLLAHGISGTDLFPHHALLLLLFARLFPVRMRLSWTPGRMPVFHSGNHTFYFSDINQQITSSLWKRPYCTGSLTDGTFSLCLCKNSNISECYF